jgi:uncharacterized protein involved in exopolysaccharide biosynthesis
MSSEEFIQSKPQANILTQVVYRYLPFWPVFLVTVSISLAIAFIYLRSQTRIYVASAKVLLKDPQKGTSDSKVLDALNIFSEKKIVENELIVLRSSSLMDEVVRELDLYTIVYNKGNVQTEELFRENCPVYFIALNKDSIQASGRHYFSIDWASEKIEIAGQTVPFNGVLTMGTTRYRVVVNKEYNRNITGKNYFAVFNSIQGASAGIISYLKASPLSYNSTVIDLKLETPVPEKGKTILNKLFEVYNEAAIQDKNQIAKNTLDFIDERLRNITLQLDSVEKNMAQFKSQNSVTDLSAQASQYFSTVKELDKELNEIDVQLEALRALEGYVGRKGRKPGTVPSLLFLNDQILLGLVQQLYSAEFEADRARSNTGERSEAVKLADEKVSRIRADIRESIGNVRNNFLIERQAISSGLASNNQLLQNVPEKQRALIDIGRQQAIKNEIYTYLLKKREETSI